MEVDILKEALGLLKKDQGINMMKLKNHEIPRRKCSLQLLLLYVERMEQGGM